MLVRAGGARARSPRGRKDQDPSIALLEEAVGSFSNNRGIAQRKQLANGRTFEFADPWWMNCWTIRLRLRVWRMDSRMTEMARNIGRPIGYFFRAILFSVPAIRREMLGAVTDDDQHG